MGQFAQFFPGKAFKRLITGKLVLVIRFATYRRELELFLSVFKRHCISIDMDASIRLYIRFGVCHHKIKVGIQVGNKTQVRFCGFMFQTTSQAVTQIIEHTVCQVHLSSFASFILADIGTYCHPRSKEIPFKRPALITIAIELILFTLFQDAQYVPVPAVILSDYKSRQCKICNH